MWEYVYPEAQAPGVINNRSFSPKLSFLKEATIYVEQPMNRFVGVL